MTFRTFEIDTHEIGGATPTSTHTTEAARNTRSRRHSALMSRRSAGARFRGLGF